MPFLNINEIADVWELLKFKACLWKNCAISTWNFWGWALFSKSKPQLSSAYVLQMNSLKHLRDLCLVLQVGHPKGSSCFFGVCLFCCVMQWEAQTVLSQCFWQSGISHNGLCCSIYLLLAVSYKASFSRHFNIIFICPNVLSVSKWNLHVLELYPEERCFILLSWHRTPCWCQASTALLTVAPCPLCLR